MVINPLKALLFLAGGTAAAAGTAYVSGALDPYLQAGPQQLAAVPQPDTASEAGRLPATDRPALPVKPDEKPAPAAKGAIVPAFDVVRAEPDGSVVVAGKAEPEASVEMLTGEQVLGTAKADASGDFAIVLDKPLKPGDYQLTLRSTAPGASPVRSAETAVVSIPETPGGQVLAMVQAPGEPAQVVTAPKPAPQGAEPVKPGASKPAGSAQSSPSPVPSGSDTQAQPVPQQEAAAAPSATAAETQPGQAAAPAVAVQAVEIEGRKIFVAGVAEPGRTVRVYANEMLIGEAKTAPNGRFLVETDRELPVGNYTIRADVLGDDGLQVIARAAVPFEREPGETIAAVAPPAPGAASAGPAVEAQDPGSAPRAAEPAGQTPPTTAAPGETAAAEASKAAAAPSVVTAPKLEPVASAVIIRRGDSLWRISRRVYGRGIRYSTIYLANQDQITNPDRIWPGQVFSVPERTEEGEAADMKAMGEQMTAKPASPSQ